MGMRWFPKNFRENSNFDYLCGLREGGGRMVSTQYPIYPHLPGHYGKFETKSALVIFRVPETF